MICPACTTAVSLVRRPLEAGLVAHGCPECEGHWLSREDYLGWLERRPVPTASSEPPPTRDLIVAEVQHAKLCPSCRRIMLRYEVGHGIELTLDVCGGCSSFWFDRNEWAALQARGLHDDLAAVATEPWQADVRRAETRRHLEALYQKRFGPDYSEVLRVQRWLHAHPQRDAILAFLDDADPFET